jgi:hypothetical protein
MISAAIGVIVIAAVIALCTPVFMIGGSHASARSVDQRVKLYDAQYFSEPVFNYTYDPPVRRLHFGLSRLLEKVRLGNLIPPPIPSVKFQGNGPQLAVIAHIEGRAFASFDLLSEDGHLVAAGAAMDAGNPDQKTFILVCDLHDSAPGQIIAHPLTNGTYRLRIGGETNDVATLRIRGQDR